MLNYVNDLILNIIEYYVEMRDGVALAYDPMTSKGNFDFANMREKIELIKNFDMAFLYLAEIHITGTTNLYTENLLNFEDFSQADYFPLVKKEFPLEYFQVSPDKKGLTENEILK